MNHSPWRKARRWNQSQDLVENAKEQKAVAWILKLHKRGESLRTIAQKLNDRGIEAGASPRVSMQPIRSVWTSNRYTGVSPNLRVPK